MICEPWKRDEARTCFTRREKAPPHSIKLVEAEARIEIETIHFLLGYLIRIIKNTLIATLVANYGTRPGMFKKNIRAFMYIEKLF